MQVRRFEKLVHTDYIVQNCGSYLAIGSAYVHDIITIDVGTLDIKTPTIIGDKDTLGRIIADIKKLPLDVLRGIMGNDDDTASLTLPVYMWKNGKIEQTWTDDYEWPNTDHKGFILYTNATFKTEKECVEYARKDTAIFRDSLENWMMRYLDEGQKILGEIRRCSMAGRYLDINYGRGNGKSDT